MLKIEGHRGFGIERKENTLDAFSEASNAGLESVELDVWLTSDFVPVVVDANTELGQCYMNKKSDNEQISIYITKTPYADLADLIYETSGENIPTLKEVIGTLKNGGTSMNAELKDWRPEVVSKTLDVIYELEFAEFSFFSSFHHFLRNVLIAEEQKRGITNRFGFGYLCMVLRGCGGIPDWDLIRKDLVPDKDLVIIDTNFVVAFEEELIEIRDNAKNFGVGLGLFSGFVDYHLETEEFFLHCLKLGVKTFIANVPSKFIEYRKISVSSLDLKEQLGKATTEDYTNLIEDISDKDYGIYCV